MSTTLLLILAVVVLLVAASMPRAATANKEGFMDYIVYGPGPWWGGWHRPRYAWRRRRWWGPCPGPWCPYASYW